MSPLPRSLLSASAPGSAGPGPALASPAPACPQEDLRKSLAWKRCGARVEGCGGPSTKSGQETERHSFLLPGSGDIDGLPKVSVCDVCSLDTLPCAPTLTPSPRKPLSPPGWRSPPLLSLQNSPNNISGISNPPGTPRDDGELGGNFLHSFQNDNVRVPAAPRHPWAIPWSPGLGTLEQFQSLLPAKTYPRGRGLAACGSCLLPSCVP